MPRFCTAIEEGRRCPGRARPGQPFCAGHDPHTFDPRPCLYFNLRRGPCLGIAIRGQDHCFAHSPRNRIAKRSPLPLIPRGRYPSTQTKLPVFNEMPQSPRCPPEVLS